MDKINGGLHLVEKEKMRLASRCQKRAMLFALDPKIIINRKNFSQHDFH